MRNACALVGLVLIGCGSKGPQGEAGPAGAKGDTGPAGMMGGVGPQGLKGDPGPQGAQGTMGAMGATGSLGGWFAEQNASLTTIGPKNPFTDVPGATVTFMLPQDGTIELDANGSVTGVAGDAMPATATHCGFRFVVDMLPYGDPTWGDVIVGCGASGAAQGWWCPWTARRSLPAKMGTHTVSLQQVGWAGTTAGCTSSSADYSAARLRVLAH